MAVTEERVRSIESTMAELARAQLRTEAALSRLADSQAKTEQELRDFKDEMADFKREAEADRKRMDKAWGDLANRLGTILEDVVAPNVQRIAEEDLHMAPLVGLVCRYRRQRPPGKWSEWDVLAVGHDAVLCCEVRSKLTLNDVPGLLEKFGRFATAFPEHASLRLIRLAASWAIEDPALEDLTRQRVYALAMSDDTMRLLDCGAF